MPPEQAPADSERHTATVAPAMARHGGRPTGSSRSRWWRDPRPRPGLTTDVLRTRFARLTAVDIDPVLAGALATRLARSNVDVVCASATGLPGGRFSGAVCLTMLHHVPTLEQQDAVLAEVHRLLRPGGTLAGEDSLDSPEFRTLHHDDICVPVAPDSPARRLESAGYIQAEVQINDYALRFRARKPPP